MRLTDAVPTPVAGGPATIVAAHDGQAAARSGAVWGLLFGVLCRTRR